MGASTLCDSRSSRRGPGGLDVERFRTLLPVALAASAILLLSTVYRGEGGVGVSLLAPAVGVLIDIAAVLGFGRLRRSTAAHPARFAVGYGCASGAAHAAATLTLQPGMVSAALLLSLLAHGAALSQVRFALLPLMAAAAAMLFAIAGPAAALGAGVLLLALAAAEMRMFAAQEDAGPDDADQDRTSLSLRFMEEIEQTENIWFWQTDREGRLVYISALIEKHLQALHVDYQGKHITKIFVADEGASHSQRSLHFLMSARTRFSDLMVLPAAEASGNRLWSISGRPHLDDMGHFRGFTGIGRDLTQARDADKEIKRLAHSDSLTGLANRGRLRTLLDGMLAGQDASRRPTAVFLLDLDRFKNVNDTLGHLAGDELLRQVSRRLEQVVENAGLVGRLGGDEFKIVLPDEGNENELGRIAAEIISALERQYTVHGAKVSIGCSIGIAISPDHGVTAEMLLRNADLALYAAKADGRGVFRFFRDKMLDAARARKSLEDDLRSAFMAEQLHLVFQPSVSTADERIIGCEALLRWDHPVRGLVSPAEFIPIAEETGLIERIGDWVLRTACAEAASWPEAVRVGVNVSPIQFANPNLPGLILSALANSGLAPERLELEITESVFLNENEDTRRMFENLKNIGVCLALDDFGTGYSSLGYLKKAPFDKIKIDQSFVRGSALAENKNREIVRAIVSLSRTLGMRTTAEGVEMQDEIALMKDLGCSEIQGFAYSPPVRSAEIHRLLSTAKGKIAPTAHRTSRLPRKRILRMINARVDGTDRSVLLRDISAGGALIEANIDIGTDRRLHLELTAGEWIEGQVRWNAGSRIGVQFSQKIDVDGLDVPDNFRKAGGF